MQKIIVVTGVSNSGKTGSMRRFLENRGIFHMREGDITLIIPIQKGKNIYAVGIASGGDTPDIVKDNFDFFSAHKLDIIICASKSRGDTLEYVRNFSRKAKAVLKEIPTVRLKKLTQAHMMTNNAIIANQIERAIP